ncbi:serine protease inhibitor 3/4-like [Pieris napi]|uniref:serine protease inhibitor 3/4-like n=1 Tax=Pieris napi TaxID=78633 RepID=UPI001FB9E234|nr:serine protease inhibitor 3/4-like [Pieris napi]
MKMINSSYRDLNVLLTHLERIDFVMVNHIYLNYSKGYKDTLSKPAFGVEVQKVSFNYPKAATIYINRMIDRVTFKRLSDVLIKEDITKDSSMLLINAAYLTATWEVPFNILHTKHNIKFRYYNQSTVFVPMMFKSEEVLYVDDDLNKIKVINMKLASPGVSMTFVIPEDRKSLQDFLRNLLRPNYFRTIKKRMRMEFLNIAIPRFKLKTLVDWTDSLQKVGLKKLFDKNSTGLNNMMINQATSKPLYISKVKQKNFIEVNEMGAYRIITTESQYSKMPHLRPTLEAVADRPFYFTVTLHFDRSNYWNTEELFTGVYYGPDT